jgi:hypothetical protein
VSVDPETLDQAGKLLLGADWKLPMATLLGPHHPEGARKKIDPRLVRRWAVGDRPIPDWVAPALGALLQERSKQLAADAKRAGFLAQFLKNGGRRG